VNLKSILKEILLLLNRNRLAILFIAIAFAFLILPETSWARAGGGGGFSDGGGSGGFSGGGNGFDIALLIYLAFRYPVVGVPLLIIVVFVIIYGNKHVQVSKSGKTIRNVYSRHETTSIETSIFEISKRDSSFDRAFFLENVKKAFFAVQKSWQNQDMRASRFIVSDGVYERFSLQIKMYESSMIVNKIEGLQIVSIGIAGAQSDTFFDTIHVRIKAVSVDYFVNKETGRQVYGDINPAEFTEYWSFIRSLGVQTEKKNGAVDGYCPNCGSPLKIADSIVCPSCSAVVNSGQYDWVLSEITQGSEWRIRDNSIVNGLEQMLNLDPGFNIQHIEDKVSVMFYRYISSQFFADAKYVMKLAGDGFVKENEDQFTAGSDGKHTFYVDAAIGSVEVVEIIPSDSADKNDQIKVKVKWAGHFEKYLVPSLIIPDFSKSRLFVNEFILERKHGVLSNVNKTLLSTHCLNCGAPETITSSGHCEYCGAPQNDGSLDWCLIKIQQFRSYSNHDEYRSALGTQKSADGTEETVLSKYDSELLLASVVNVMLADGVTDENEIKLLYKIAKKYSVEEERLNMIIQTVKANGFTIPAPETKEAVTEFLRCMTQMALINGKITSEEMMIMKKVSLAFGYSDIDLNLLIKRERGKLYKQVISVNRNL